MRSQNQDGIRKELAETRHELKGEMAGLRGEITDLRGKTAALSQDLGDFKLSADQRFREQGVLMEALRSNVEQIAEDVIFLQDQIRANREERAAQFSQLESLLRHSYSGWIAV